MAPCDVQSFVRLARVWDSEPLMHKTMSLILMGADAGTDADADADAAKALAFLLLTVPSTCSHASGQILISFTCPFWFQKCLGTP